MKTQETHQCRHGVAGFCAACSITAQETLVGAQIESKTLSDGSKVYAVHIPDETVDCLTENDALYLASEINKLVRVAIARATGGN